jgi:hypothetical protein
MCFNRRRTSSTKHSAYFTTLALGDTCPGVLVSCLKQISPLFTFIIIIIIIIIAIIIIIIIIIIRYLLYAGYLHCIYLK